MDEVKDNGEVAVKTEDVAVDNDATVPQTAEPKKKKKRKGRRKKEVDDGVLQSQTPDAAAEPVAEAPSKLGILCVFRDEHPIDEYIKDRSVYTPIFGGKVDYNGDSQFVIDMLGDDTGDNISDMNKYLNGISAMYWAWKHYDEFGSPEFIGFNQYNRFIAWKDEYLSTDTIVATECELGGKSVYEHYRENHVIEDLDAFNRHLFDDVFHGDMRMIRSYDRFMHRQKLCTNNMFIMSKEAFFDFMENFMSKCIDVCRGMLDGGEIDIERPDVLQRQAYAFITERMTGFYIYHLTTIGGFKFQQADVVCVD